LFVFATPAAKKPGRISRDAFAGLADSEHATFLVRHHAIDGRDLSAILERRWPNVLLGDPRIPCRYLK
jgi:hypothetical protein